MNTLLPAVPENLLDVETGELLPASPRVAHRALTAARVMKTRLQAVIDDATAYLLAESRLQGTKTFHTPDGDVVLTGGPAVEYDPEKLAGLLAEAGCPDERIQEAVTPVVSYKVNRAVLRQLVGANPDYRAAAELAEVEVVKPFRASAR